MTLDWLRRKMNNSIDPRLKIRNDDMQFMRFDNNS